MTNSLDSPCSYSSFKQSPHAGHGGLAVDVYTNFSRDGRYIDITVT